MKASDLKEKLLFSIQSLCEIGEELSSSEKFEQSSLSVLHLIMGTLTISKAGILLYDPDTMELRLLASRGAKNTDVSFTLTESVKKSLRKGSSVIPVSSPGSPELEAFFAEHKDDLDNLNSFFWVPLRVSRQLLGVISISKKFMGQNYEPVDFELLNVIAMHLSLGIFNYSLINDLKAANFQLNRKLLELETLYDLGIAIGSIMDESELTEQILFNAVGLTDAGAGVLALKEADGSLRLASGINLPADEVLSLSDYEPLAAVLEENEPLMDNCGDDLGDHPYGFKKMLFVPLSGQHEILGLIGLANKEDRDGIIDFTVDDQRLLQNFATQAGVAIENAKFYAESLEKERLERELQVAATIQRNILPKEPPSVSGMQIAATTIPSRFVGGDHYDFLRRNGDHLFSIADVSGKGMPAALLVSTLHATQHALSGENWDYLNTLVAKISKAIFKSSLSNKFISFFYAQYNPESRLLCSVNAGHNYPIIISADGSKHYLKRGGLCLGLLPKSEYEIEETTLKPGDVLILYTDGVTESFNFDDEEYGEERLEAVVQANRHRTAQEIFDEIMAGIEAFTAGAPQHDDITLVVYKVI